MSDNADRVRVSWFYPVGLLKPKRMEYNAKHWKYLRMMFDDLVRNERLNNYKYTYTYSIEGNAMLQVKATINNPTGYLKGLNTFYTN